MKNIMIPFLLFSILLACCSHKNFAQRGDTSSQDTLVNRINTSATDTDIINSKLKNLQRTNDLLIAFGSLNYAWTRKGIFHVLGRKGKVWKLYVYESKLPPTAEEQAADITPQDVPAATAARIEQLYAASQLWNTKGDKDGNFCEGKKDCNINDAETWVISVATPQNIHTTNYYAPKFFEECCLGNLYRKQFVAIAEEMMKLGSNQSSAPER